MRETRRLLIETHRRGDRSRFLPLLDLALTSASNADRCRWLARALLLSLRTGDLERAATYEAMCHQVLQASAADPEVRAWSFRLHLNMGLVAIARGQYPVAYWHFIQGAARLKDGGHEDAPGSRRGLFWLCLYGADASLHMGRTPEAREALDEAASCITDSRQALRLGIGQANWLRCARRPREAAELLERLATETSPEAWTKAARAHWLLARGEAAREDGDLATAVRCLVAAESEESVARGPDQLLARIQRRRSPQARLKKAPEHHA